MREWVLWILSRLHKGLYWVEWRFFEEDDGEDCFIHLRLTEGDLRLNMLRDHDEEGNPRYPVDVVRASAGDPSTDSEAELRERARINDRLAGRLADLGERVERVLEGNPSLNDLEGAKSVRQKLDSSRERLDLLTSKVSAARK